MNSNLTDSWFSANYSVLKIERAVQINKGRRHDKQSWSSASVWMSRLMLVTEADRQLLK